jgi:hypothetical protein
MNFCHSGSYIVIATPIELSYQGYQITVGINCASGIQIFKFVL